MLSTGHSLCRAAGLPNERLHNLRHSAATIMLGHGGADLTMVKDTLGHSTIAVTADLYIHGIPSLKRAVAAQMGAVLLGPGLSRTDQALSG